MQYLKAYPRHTKSRMCMQCPGTLWLERQIGPVHWTAGLCRNLLEMQFLRTQPRTQSDSQSETQGTPGWSPASLSLTRSPVRFIHVVVRKPPLQPTLSFSTADDKLRPYMAMRRDGTQAGTCFAVIVTNEH
jgi:hypothetical protein